MQKNIAYCHTAGPQVAPVVMKAELLLSSWTPGKDRCCFSTTFVRLKLIGRKNLARSFWEMGFELEKLGNALVCFVLKKKAIILEDKVADPSSSLGAARFGPSVCPKILSWHWKTFTPFYRG